MPSDRVLADDTDTDDRDEAAVAGDNVYEVTIRATEMLVEGQDPPALFSVLYVTVTVEDVNEAGTISLDRLQPQAGAALTASYSDPDDGQDPDSPAADQNVVWLWSVPKVSRPIIDNEAHWQAAGAQDTNAPAYTPVDTDDASDVDKRLRVKVTYNDAQSSTKTRPLYMLSYYDVRAVPAANQPPVFDDNADFDTSVPEDTAVGTVVGVPVTATDPNESDNVLSYTLIGDDASSFNINIRTGQITLAAGLDHENNNGVYNVTVNVFDPSNATDTQPVVITATDVNEAPTVTGAATGTVAEVDSTPEDTDREEYVPFASAPYVQADVGRRGQCGPGVLAVRSRRGRVRHQHRRRRGLQE